MTASTACRGYSLLELAVVLTIIALIVAMGMPIGLETLESAKRGQTNTKLDTIENALAAFRAVNNRLPCPGDASLAATNANYGVEAATPGTCTGGTPAANFSGNKVIEGAVPVKTLGLPEAFMYDAWGRKFAYAVDKRVTATRAMLSMGLNEMCKVTVKDAGGGDRTTGGLYTLLSFGPDGHGGYNKNGTRVSTGSINADTLTNCHCDAAAAATAYAPTYVQKEATETTTATDTFDDVVRFKERWQMMTADDPFNAGGQVCAPPGFRVDGGIAGHGVGGGVAFGDVNGDGFNDLVIGGYRNPNG